jgi:outer membrane protein OmpA-like peptidoglycan-associated protein
VNKPKDVAKQQGTSRLNSKIDRGIDEGFNKVEEGIGNLFKKKKDNADEADESDDSTTEDENSESDDRPVQTSQKPKLESATQYDFVPGDVILYFDDFSQDAVGDYPALWSSNSSGEVKTVNIAPGHWFHMNGEDAVYCYTKQITFPDNFIIEFDIIPDEEYNYGSTLTLYQDDPDDPKELNDDLYPGIAGLHITMDKERWETKGYKVEEDWISGQGSKNPVIREELNHVIIWIQKRRVRIYHKGAKTIDMPTNIYEGTKFNRLRFSGWDAYSWPMISNLKITTAAPDTRSKLITEGKLVTYGITFDVNKADIKPEAYGTLKDIASVLKENPDVRIKIVGHTDSDGKDDLNLDLSARRALAVKSELAKTFGIDASRMETEGAGETQALAPNDSPENKAKNRRVELIKL